MPIDVLFDATPLSAGHATRGIGLTTAHLLDAIRHELPFDARPTLLTRRGHTPPEGYPNRDATWPRWPTHHLPDPWPHLTVNRAIRRAEPRLFHATQPQVIPKLASGALVITCYDLTPLHDNIRNPLHRTAYGAYLEQLTRARLILAISHATADDLQRELAIPADRIRVTPLAAPQAPPPDGPTPATPYLLYANSIEPHKNPQLAIDILRHMPDIRLVMTGTWSRRRLDRLRRRATDLGVDSRIDWMGYVPAARLAALRRDAVAVLVPSRREGFGLPILEALAAGTPCVAADIPVLREVGGAVTEYRPPDDPRAWAEAIRDLSRAPGDEQSARTRRDWAGTFTWQRTAALTVAAWREALS